MSAERRIQIALPSTGDDEWQAAREPIESGWLTQGPKVAEFERAFAARHDVPRALATTSCTTALHLALAALGVGPGDEIVVPAFTWVASANVVLYQGATPVFVDVDPSTYNVDPAALADALTERTRAVIPVHMFGLCADMPGVREAVPDGIPLIEDAACAAGAALGGRAAGGLGDVAAFSFHPRKTMTTGEGGMLTTHDADLADRADRMRNHGASVSEEVRHHGPAPHRMADFDLLGFNYRMTDLQAAVGLVQLGKLDGFIAERDRWARWYSEQLSALGWIEPPHIPDGYDHAWQAYVTVVSDDAPVSRDDLMDRLAERGVSTRPGTHCVTNLGLYRERGDRGVGACPVAESLERRTMALPLHNRMTAEDYEYVVATLRDIAG